MMYQADFLDNSVKIMKGDCLEVMKVFPENSIDFIVCDPPYGLHFMGKKWDSAVPNIEIWQEALRVCKPGSMLAAFGGSRTHHHLMIALEKAGWEVRDVIMFLYGQGFPKSHNFGRKLDEKWHPYGTALKPAYEPIIICMKPLDGTFAQNAEKWGVAGINIDDSRVGTDDTRNFKSYPMTSKGIKGGGFASNKMDYKTRNICAGSECGRWPANVILDEEAGAQLDEMTGVLKSGKTTNKQTQDSIFGKRIMKEQAGSVGCASRFFYCAKASNRERNEGCEDKRNIHPTIKPQALMRYIIKLLAPPGNPVLLDPFMGSGSTLVAAAELGIQAIGIELSEEYCEIARCRLKHYEEKV